MQFEFLERCRDRGSDRAAELVELFRATFTASEGEVQGGLIAALVGELCEGMEGSEILCCGAVDAGRLVGAIFFTRLRFADESLIYLLSPVAVSTARQRSGVGQALIRFGLDAIAARGALAAITYGDPVYYGRFGFTALAEDVIQAPMPLSMPVGWLGRSLTGQPIEARPDRPRCVAAFRNEAYW